jgi:hypothetical protein
MHNTVGGCAVRTGIVSACACARVCVRLVTEYAQGCYYYDDAKDQKYVRVAGDKCFGGEMWYVPITLIVVLTNMTQGASLRDEVVQSQ